MVNDPNDHRLTAGRVDPREKHHVPLVVHRAPARREQASVAATVRIERYIVERPHQTTVVGEPLGTPSRLDRVLSDVVQISPRPPGHSGRHVVAAISHSLGLAGLEIEGLEPARLGLAHGFLQIGLQRTRLARAIAFHEQTDPCAHHLAQIGIDARLTGDGLAFGPPSRACPELVAGTRRS